MKKTVQSTTLAQIKKMCKQRNWTDYRLAIEAGMPYPSVKNIFAGRTQTITVQTVQKMCDAFEITLGEFFSAPEFDALGE